MCVQRVPCAISAYCSNESFPQRDFGRTAGAACSPTLAAWCSQKKLGGMRGAVPEDGYEDIASFKRDVELVCENAIQFNAAQKDDPKGPYQAALKVKELFEKEWVGVDKRIGELAWSAMPLKQRRALEEAARAKRRAEKKAEKERKEREQREVEEEAKKQEASVLEYQTSKAKTLYERPLTEAGKRDLLAKVDSLIQDNVAFSRDPRTIYGEPYCVVRKPMWLKRVKGNLQKGTYTTPLDVAKDVRRVFTNCLQFMYDPEESVMGDSRNRAIEVLDEFDEWFYKKFGGSGPPAAFAWPGVGACRQVLEKVLSVRGRKPGKRPPDEPKDPAAMLLMSDFELVIPGSPTDYREIVKKPMSFGRITRRLYTGRYRHYKDFAHDVRRCIDNWNQYWKETSFAHFDPDGHPPKVIASAHLRNAKILHDTFEEAYHDLVLTLVPTALAAVSTPVAGGASSGGAGAGAGGAETTSELSDGTVSTLEDGSDSDVGVAPALDASELSSTREPTTSKKAVKRKRDAKGGKAARKKATDGGGAGADASDVAASEGAGGTNAMAAGIGGDIAASGAAAGSAAGVVAPVATGLGSFGATGGAGGVPAKKRKREKGTRPAKRSRMAPTAGMKLLHAPRSRSTRDLKKLSDVEKRYITAIDELFKVPEMLEFCHPVVKLHPEIADAYNSIIGNPLDLGTVEKRIFKHEYEHPAQLLADLRLIFDNALKFNEGEEDVKKDLREVASMMKWLAESVFFEHVVVEPDDPTRMPPGAPPGWPKPEGEPPVIDDLVKERRALLNARRDRFDSESSPEAFAGAREVLEHLAGPRLKKSNFYFLTPVAEQLIHSPTTLADYQKHIKNPMDLRTVTEKLDRGEYATLKDMREDLELIFDNAMRYNFRERTVQGGAYIMAERMKVHLEKHWRAMCLKLELKQRREALQIRERAVVVGGSEEESDGSEEETGAVASTFHVDGLPTLSADVLSLLQGDVPTARAPPKPTTEKSTPKLILRPRFSLGPKAAPKPARARKPAKVERGASRSSSTSRTSTKGGQATRAVPAPVVSAPTFSAPAVPAAAEPAPKPKPKPKPRPRARPTRKPRKLADDDDDFVPDATMDGESEDEEELARLSRAARAGEIDPDDLGLDSAEAARVEAQRLAVAKKAQEDHAKLRQQMELMARERERAEEEQEKAEAKRKEEEAALRARQRVPVPLTEEEKEALAERAADAEAARLAAAERAAKEAEEAEREQEKGQREREEQRQWTKEMRNAAVDRALLRSGARRQRLRSQQASTAADAVAEPPNSTELTAAAESSEADSAGNRLKESQGARVAGTTDSVAQESNEEERIEAETRKLRTFLDSIAGEHGTWVDLTKRLPSHDGLGFDREGCGGADAAANDIFDEDVRRLDAPCEGWKWELANGDTIDIRVGIDVPIGPTYAFVARRVTSGDGECPALEHTSIRLEAEDSSAELAVEVTSSGGCDAADYLALKRLHISATEKEHRDGSRKDALSCFFGPMLPPHVFPELALLASPLLRWHEGAGALIAGPLQRVCADGSASHVLHVVAPRGGVRIVCGGVELANSDV